MLDIDEITRKAVLAALDIIDTETGGRTGHWDGPCGDLLASNLHRIIEASLKEEFNRKH